MIRLALLWHMHQPDYRDPASGQSVLPWVRMHALKDYRGMVDVLREYPGVRATINVVPSLTCQLLDYAEGRTDDHLRRVRDTPTAELHADERAFLLTHGFHAPHHRMIAPHPRYAELSARRGEGESWSLDDVRDLQVWHTLAWMDPDWLLRDSRLAALRAKGRQFSEDDKATLAAVERELLQSTIPALADAAAAGQVELSTSPFYHPILPLLCDTDTHLAVHPESPRPEPPFRWPRDARVQLSRASGAHASVFGRRPSGLWPSEGGVSDEVVQMATTEGFTWLASDEHVLARSLGEPMSRDHDGRPERAAQLYRPWHLSSVGEEGPRLVFRDQMLSDRIGFIYQSWDAEHAADDLVWRIRDSGARYVAQGGQGDPLIAIVLDGENAWEHYPDGGRPFLRAFYGRLQDAGDIAAVTMREAVASDGPVHQVSHLVPGSWIHADFSVWAGHEEDCRAWSALARARWCWERRSALVSSAASDRAYESLLAAEGSDWFWWYGDDHSSSLDGVFDGLFRTHLRRVYEALEWPVPDELRRPLGGARCVDGDGVMSRGW
ncbi:MAG: glycoside hydrolase [Acidobacteria bacterium]|nr:glycoside hydrolase [Acidobacteriota bacterium]